MSLSKDQIRQYKAQAHHLKPVVMIGQHGLTDAVLAEIDLALNTHELIKIKIGSEDRDERAKITEAIGQKSESALVQSIGRTAVFYRRKPEED